jgi:hypothetical protein
MLGAWEGTTINYTSASTQLLLNECISCSENRVQKHLMEQIINLFEYTCNLIRGDLATRASGATEPRHGPGEL